MLGQLHVGCGLSCFCKDNSFLGTDKSCAILGPNAACVSVCSNSNLAMERSPNLDVKNLGVLLFRICFGFRSKSLVLQDALSSPLANLLTSSFTVCPKQ